jgi:mono/diheme cytochrome c family protein
MPRWAVIVLVLSSLAALVLGAWLAWPAAPRPGTFPTDDPQLGRRVYAYCQGCHGTDGRGIAGNYPPLAGSVIATADPTISIRLVLRGMQSERLNGRMPGFAATLTDAEIAAVLSWMRSAWGNAALPVTPAQVATERRP